MKRQKSKIWALTSMTLIFLIACSFEVPISSELPPSMSNTPLHEPVETQVIETADNNDAPDENIVETVTSEVVETRRIPPDVLPDEGISWGDTGGGGPGICYEVQAPEISLSSSPGEGWRSMSIEETRDEIGGINVIYVDGCSYPPGEIVEVKIERPDNQIESTIVTAGEFGEWYVNMRLIPTDPLGAYRVIAASESGTFTEIFIIEETIRPNISVNSCQFFPRPNASSVRRFPDNLVTLKGFQPEEEVLMAIYAQGVDKKGFILPEDEAFSLLNTWYVKVDEHGGAVTNLPPGNISTVRIVAIGQKAPLSFAWPLRDPTQPMISAATERYCFTTSPIDTVHNYWLHVSGGRYEDAWQMLSPSFQDRMHGGNYADYFNGHQSSGYCSIETSDENLVQYDGERAVVSTHIVYRKGADCDAYEYNFDITLVFDESRHAWLYEATEIK